MGLNPKPEPSLRPYLEELERFHAWANGALFGGQLARRAIITVAPGGQRKANGWFAPFRWQATGRPDDRPHEIVIAAEHANLPPVEVLQILLREMVHQANAEAGIQDVNPRSGYHNRQFKREAEARGLRVERAGWRGWCRTMLAPETRRLILDGFKPDATKFSAFRPHGDHPKGPKKLRKWQCACPVSIWAAVAEVPFTCKACGAEVTRVETGRRR